MKRIAKVSTMGLFVAVLAVSLVGAQSAPLGDYARQVRKQKRQQVSADRKFDNDNLPTDNKLSVVGQTPAPSAEPSATADNGDAAPASHGSGTPGAATGDAASRTQTHSAPKAAEGDQAQKQQAYKDWQTKIQAQRSQIDVLARELDVTNREYRLRAAAFYADAGNRLRNAGAWDKEDAQYKDQIAEKQRKLDQAKQQLEEIEEQARKAGLPSSMRE